MKVADIRELTAEEIKTQISEARKELVGFRFQQSMRKLESTARIKTTRQKLARLLTIETEKEKGIEGRKPQAKKAAKVAASAGKTAKAKTGTKADAKKSTKAEEKAASEKAAEE
jgi:large subunit ribosomal protein L29